MELREEEQSWEKIVAVHSPKDPRKGTVKEVTYLCSEGRNLCDYYFTTAQSIFPSVSTHIAWGFFDRCDISSHYS